MSVLYRIWKKKVFLIERVVAVVFLKRVYYYQLMVGSLLKFHKGTDPRDSWRLYKSWETTMLLWFNCQVFACFGYSCK